MKKVLTLMILISSAMMNSSCDKEEICSAIYLADMVCSELAIAVPTVETGVAFALTTIVKNIAESTNFCETETAENSNTGYAVEFRSDENSPWEDAQIADQNGALQFEVFVPTSPLPPNETTGFEPDFVMDEPGQYRFGSEADGMTEVIERNEGNNGNISNQGTIRAAISPTNSKYAIVTVVPSAVYVPVQRSEGEPAKVKYLGFTKLW